MTMIYKNEHVFLQVLTVMLLCCIGSAANAQTIMTSANDQSELNVTIYNNNLALIKDQRDIRIPAGDVDLEFQDVSQKIKPESSVFSAGINSQNIRLKELSFDYDLLTPKRLLEKHVGESINVEITNPVTGEKSIESAKVLSTQEGVLLQFADRIVTAGDDYQYIFRRLPEDLRSKPTLTLSLENQAQSINQVELAYLTEGLTWNSDYVARLNDTEDRLSINGWVTLKNQTGVRFNNVKLQLVSGKVNVVNNEPEIIPRKLIANVAQARSEEIPQEALLDYHLYSLDRTTDIANDQTKQVSLLSVAEIPVRKQYILESSGYWNYAKDPSPKRKQPVYIWLDFDNEAENNLGQPLPAGIVRVYKEDSAGRAQFVGEDEIDHISRGEKVRLNVGEAFDVKADRFQSKFKLMPSNNYNSVSEVENTVILQNSRNDDIMVVIRETMFGEWEILEETHKRSNEQGSVVEWVIAVPANSEVEHRYSVRVRY